MSEYEEVRSKFAATAAEDLKPLTDEAARAIGAEDTEAKEYLGLFLAKAWMAGAQAGQDEVLAQAAEQGYNVKVDVLRPDQG
jgi:hypothetical protein